MHLAFIPYGDRRHVERLLQDLENKWAFMTMTKGDQKKQIPLQTQVRQLPLGVYEFIFPREIRDQVLTAMVKDGETNRYQIPTFYLNRLRKLLRLKPIPKEYDKSKAFLCAAISPEVAVNIIPLGIREDTDIVGTKELDNGWTHEAI